MQAIIDFFTNGGASKIMEIVLGLSATITIITGMTKTPKDDAFMVKVNDWITKIFSFVTHKDAPGTLKLPFQSARGKQE